MNIFDCVKMTQQNVVVSDTKSGVSLTVFPTTTQKPPAAPGGYISIPRRRVLKNLEINGGQRINAWVESMRASSPTHHKSTPLSQEHNSWILHHPSALDMFDQIIDASKGKQIVMFLDYDGTLSPIVDDPDRAFMSDSMRKTVRKLARCFPTAIVTGRCKDKVYNFVRLAELYYAGSHGMDIKGPTRSSKYNKDSKAEAILCQPASDFLPLIDEVYQQLVEKTKSTPGALVENNKFCLSVHFRCVDEKKWSELARQVKSVLKEYPKLRLTQGRKVLEIRPTIKWDKGKALEFLLESLGLANCSDVFPVYIGDDRSDEDAFKVMNFLQRLVEWKHVSLGARSRVTAISSNAPFSSGDNSIIDSCTASRPTKLRQRSNRKESNTMNELFDKARCKCYYESMDGLGKARKYLVRKLNTKM
ncbi:putative trehalose-phosphate phosphatase J [Glycine soja]